MKIEIISNLEVRNRQGDLTDSQSGYFDRKKPQNAGLCRSPFVVIVDPTQKRFIYFSRNSM